MGKNFQWNHLNVSMPKILSLEISFQTQNWIHFYSGNIECMPKILRKLFWVWKLIESMPKILSLETYWIHGLNFESGNLLNIWQKLSVETLNTWLKFWVICSMFPLKVFEYMTKILSLETLNTCRKFWVWKHYMAKILSLESYWMHAKNFESGNLLNVYRTLNPWRKFWVWKLIEYMVKILSLETCWINSENF